MRVLSVLAGKFKLDGGAMFGVVPKTIWNKPNLSDENNLVTLAMRCLVIESEKQMILIDTGIGNKLPPQVAKHYHIHPDIYLENSLRQYGISPDQITDVILSHLHLDHAGGAIKQVGEHQFTTSFSHANYWTSKEQWQWAIQNPNPREKASFRSENLLPLEQSGQLKLIDEHSPPIAPCLDMFFVNGHTRGMLLPHLKTPHHSILFASDLLPSIYHIPLAYIPSYDVYPIASMEEKAIIFEKCVQEKMTIFLDHDEVHECCTLQKTDKGFELKDVFCLNEA